MLLPDLVVHMIGHSVHVEAHGIPEIPYKVYDMIIRPSRIFRIPGNNVSILINFNIVVNELLCRQFTGKQDN
jgi:molybdopterin biosynthesis enzyme